MNTLTAGFPAGAFSDEAESFLNVSDEMIDVSDAIDAGVAAAVVLALEILPIGLTDNCHDQQHDPSAVAIANFVLMPKHMWL